MVQQGVGVRVQGSNRPGLRRDSDNRGEVGASAGRGLAPHLCHAKRQLHCSPHTVNHHGWKVTFRSHFRIGRFEKIENDLVVHTNSLYKVLIPGPLKTGRDSSM